MQDCTFSSEDDTVCVMRNRLAVQGTRNSQVSLSSNQESDFRWEDAHLVRAGFCDTQFIDAVASQVLAPVSYRLTKIKASSLAVACMLYSYWLT